MLAVRGWEPAFARVVAGLVCLALASCASLATMAERRGGDAVTQWRLIADYYGNGAANSRTLAIMQMAMHDALNAAHPLYEQKHASWPSSLPRLRTRPL